MFRSRAASLALVLFTASSVFASSLTENMEAVEKIRGRKFVTAVKTAQVERAKLGKQLEAQIAKDLPYSIEDWGRILRALQLVDEEPKQIMPKLINLYEEQVLAFYDPETHIYYSIDKPPAAMLRDLPEGADPAMFEEMVQVHELMHALQDQHWKIAERDKKLRTDTDGMLAYHALLEGEAVLVMMANLMSGMGVQLDQVLKNDQIAATMINAVKSEQDSVSADAPRYFVEFMKFPYLDGLSFVIAAYRRGGWKEIDKIHANPPRTSREILHPEDYFSGKFQPEPFDDTKPEGAISAEHLGEFHWGYLAGAENARGWMGDRVVVMKDGRVDISTKWETPAHAKKFASAYGKFLTSRKIDAKVMHEENAVRVTYVAP